MAVPYRCPRCGKLSTAPDGFKQPKARCPYCGLVFPIVYTPPPTAAKQLPASRRRVPIAAGLAAGALVTIGGWALFDQWLARRQGPVVISDKAIEIDPLERDERFHNSGIGWSLNQVTDSWNPDTGWHVTMLSRMSHEDEGMICALQFDNDLGLVAFGPAENLTGLVAIIHLRNDDRDRTNEALISGIVARVMDVPQREIAFWFERATGNIAAGHDTPPLEGKRLKMSAMVMRGGEIWIFVTPRGYTPNGSKLSDELSQS